MSAARLVSVNVGQPRTVSWATELPTTSIEKRPVPGPVDVTAAGVQGDSVSDTRHHGGTYQAVYAYALEDYDYWSNELSAELQPGLFGENLTTVGIDLNAAVVGETWRVGTVLFQIAHVRIPCNTFKGRLGEAGLDNTAWVKRFAAAGRPGPYLRVLEEGRLSAGDSVEVVDRPGHGVTVATMFRALTTERDLLPELLAVEGIKPSLHVAAREYLDGQARE